MLAGVLRPFRLGAFAVIILAALTTACSDGAAPTLLLPTTAMTSTATPMPSASGESFPSSPSPAKHGGVLVLANRGDPPSGFDTTRTSSIALHHVGGALFGAGNLVRRCRENMYIVCPETARSWTANPGFTEWTFNLRDDVLWHDGTPFTAADAKLWFALSHEGFEAGGGVRAPAYFKGELGDIEGVEALENNRLRVTLRDRNPQFLEALANPRMKMAHPRHLTEPALQRGEMSVSPLDMGLVGTGPFRFARYDRGSLVRVQRFDRYWETGAAGSPLPYLDGIDFVIMPEPFAMDAAFRSGRLDGGARGEGHYLTVERKEGYVRDLGSRVFFAEMEGGMFRLAFNVLKPGPWQDPRVRRAISLWIDKQAAIPAALGGFGYTAPSLGPYNPYKAHYFVNWPRFDPAPLGEKRAQATRLMAEAGYADGFAMGHLCRALFSPRCEFLKDQLAGLRIDLRLQVVDEGEWNRARVGLDYDSQQGAQTPALIPEGTESVYGRFSQNPDAYAKHEDEAITGYYARLREASALDARIAIWSQIERYLYLEQSYIVSIAETIQVVPYRTYVKGLVVPPEDGHTHTDFATVWLDKGAE